MYYINLLTTKSAVIVDSATQPMYGYKIDNPTGTKVIAGENNVTEFQVTYPDVYANYDKYVTMKNERGEGWRIDFDTKDNIQTFALPDKMTYAGYTRLYFAATLNDLVSLWDNVPIKIWSTSPDYESIASGQPDLIYEAIDTANEAIEIANKAMDAVQYNKGFYDTPEDLIAAYPVADDGDYAIVGTTDTFWVWDSHTNTWKNSGQQAAIGTTVTVNGVEQVTWDADTKLDKNTGSSEYEQLYGKGIDGSNVMYNASEANDGYTVAIRGGGGILKVGTPQDLDDAATKGYVDSADSNKADIYYIESDNEVATTNIIVGMDLSGKTLVFDTTTSPEEYWDVDAIFITGENDYTIKTTTMPNIFLRKLNETIATFWAYGIPNGKWNYSKYTLPADFGKVTEINPTGGTKYNSINYFIKVEVPELLKVDPEYNYKNKADIYWHSTGLALKDITVGMDLSGKTLIFDTTSSEYYSWRGDNKVWIQSSGDNVEYKIETPYSSAVVLNKYYDNISEGIKDFYAGAWNDETYTLPNDFGVVQYVIEDTGGVNTNTLSAIMKVEIPDSYEKIDPEYNYKNKADIYIKSADITVGTDLSGKTIIFNQECTGYPDYWYYQVTFLKSSNNYSFYTDHPIGVYPVSLCLMKNDSYITQLSSGYGSTFKWLYTEFKLPDDFGVVTEINSTRGTQFTNINDVFTTNAEPIRVDCEYLYNELDSKADKSYVDERIGDIDSVLDAINRTVI